MEASISTKALVQIKDSSSFPSIMCFYASCSLTLSFSFLPTFRLNYHWSYPACFFLNILLCHFFYNLTPATRREHPFVWLFPNSSLPPSATGEQRCGSSSQNEVIQRDKGKQPSLFNLYTRSCRRFPLLSRMRAANPEGRWHLPISFSFPPRPTKKPLTSQCTHTHKGAVQNSSRQCRCFH